MQIALHQEQSLLVEQIRSYLQHQPPGADTTKAFPKRLSAFAEQGVLGLCVPEALEGPEIDAVTLCHCIAAVAQYDAELALAMAITNGFVIECLLRSAPTAQTKAALRSIDQAFEWAAWLPPTPSIQLENIDGQWQLHGTSKNVPLVADTSSMLVLAYTPEGEPRACWLKTSAEGVNIHRHSGSLGFRQAGLAEVSLERVKLEDTQVFEPALQEGETHEDWVASIEACGNTALAAVSWGLGKAALGSASHYAKERKQFGKPLSAFQAIQWKIADMAMVLEAAGLLVSCAAATWQSRQSNRTKELVALSHAARKASAEAATQAAQDAIQIHGGYGFTTEFPVEKLYRNAHALRASWQFFTSDVLANFPLQLQFA